MTMKTFTDIQLPDMSDAYRQVQEKAKKDYDGDGKIESCLLYTSDAADE